MVATYTRTTNLVSTGYKAYRTKVLLVDAQPLFLEGMRHALEDYGAFEVVGQASSAHQAFALVKEFHPQVVILADELSGVSGSAFGKLIHKTAPNAALILLTSKISDAEILKAVTMEGAAVLTRDRSAGELVKTVQQVAAGNSLLTELVTTNPYLAAKLMQQLQSQQHTKILPDGTRIVTSLSQRELEVLDRVVHGHTNKEISRLLKISDQTVKNHLTNIFKKLGVSSRTEASTVALRRDWVA